MLRSVLFDLEPQSRGGNPTICGKHVHGWFIDEYLSRRDAALAAQLHAEARHKPFTVWAGPRPDSPPGMRPPMLALRVTGLSARVSTALPSRPDDVGILRFGTEYYRPSPRLSPATDDVWSAEESYESLWRRTMEAAVRPSSRVRLVFLSPAAFAARGRATLFPLGHLVYEGLFRRWRTHSSVDISDALAAMLLENVREEAHQVWSAPVVFSRFTEKGFLGWCEYSLGPHARADACCLLHLLSHFAFYAGVGSRTTWGMGQTVVAA